MASSFFNGQQRDWVGEVLGTAETLVGGHFRIDLADPERFPYDVRTLAALRRQEKTRKALAQVCKYEVRREKEVARPGRREFYRICLQDDKILNAIETEPPEMLKPLLLYVITHEIIHVARFSLEPGRFYLETQRKSHRGEIRPSEDVRNAESDRCSAYRASAGTVPPVVGRKPAGGLTRRLTRQEGVFKFKKYLICLL